MELTISGQMRRYGVRELSKRHLGIKMSFRNQSVPSRGNDIPSWKPSGSHRKKDFQIMFQTLSSLAFHGNMCTCQWHLQLQALDVT